MNNAKYSDQDTLIVTIIGKTQRLSLKAITAVLLLTFLGAAHSSFSENIEVPNKTYQSSTPKPPKGINKRQVEARFGSPQSKYGPTGNPAIYYWEYPEYTVYFENNIVIHSVSKSKSLQAY